jgi:apolipoprotein D and lipocalin family protein
MRRALLLVLLLAACAPEPPAAPSFRDRGVPMGSTTRGTIQDLAGDWEVTAGYPGVPFAAPSTHLRVEPMDGGRARLVFEGPGGLRDVAVRTGAPGRLIPEDGSAEIWVLWVDDDFRTAAVGHARRPLRLDHGPAGAGLAGPDGGGAGGLGVERLRHLGAGDWGGGAAVGRASARHDDRHATMAG